MLWLWVAAKVKVEAATVSASATMQNAACNFDFISFPQDFVGAERGSAGLREQRCNPPQCVCRSAL